MTPTPLAKSLDQAVEFGRAVAPVAQRALKDPEVRKALTATAVQARALYDDARRDSSAKLGSRLARDRRFQEDLGELVRNAADTVDQARTPKRHRFRRFLLWVGALGGAAFVAVKFLKGRAPEGEPTATNPASVSPNGVAHSPAEPGSEYASHS